MPRLFGMEVEVPFSITASARSRESSIDNAVSALLGVARRTIPSLGSGNGIFLGNGGRLYQDVGHPEVCTPECEDPKTATRYYLANEAMMKDLAQSLVSTSVSIEEARLFRNNVNYSPDSDGEAKSWGTHESYMHKEPIDAATLITHFVTRIIYTGAGGFDPFQRSGATMRFTLSPRAWFMSGTSGSSDTMCDRTIFNTREESLCRGYHRMHVICGENNCSHLATYLKLGTSALITLLTEHGVKLSARQRLAEPLGAMHEIALDTTCKKQMALGRGQATAVEVQRRLLDLVRTNLGRDYMPGWAEELCNHWDATLALLADDAPNSVNRKLDWAIKHRVFEDFLKKQEWARSFLAGNFGGAYLREVSEKLFELDVQFGRYDTPGIFESLDASGVLDHRVDGIDNIDDARANAPEIGRAHLRGKWIKELSSDERASANWSFVHDPSNHRKLDLSDPFTTEERWETIGDRGRGRSPAPTAPAPEIRENWSIRPTAPGQEVAQPFAVGDRVTLGRHGSVNGSTNWGPNMEPHVGQQTVITELMGPDWGGCVSARVEIDSGAHYWRMRDMQQVTATASTDTSDSTASGS